MTRAAWRYRGAIAVGGLLAACSGGGGSALSPLPPPPSTQARPATTVAVDYTNVTLPALGAGHTTSTTVMLGPGAATINGKVLAPDGTPAESATVRVERMVGRNFATTDVIAGADGAWTVPGVLGGSYRVRAWRAPDSALEKPAFFFVGATETYPVQLKLDRIFGTSPRPKVVPSRPVVGQTASLFVDLRMRSVDSSGLVHAVPMAGASVALIGGTGWTVVALSPGVADGSGRARWDLTCRGAGVQPLRLVVNGTEQFQLVLPACTDPPPPPAPPPSIDPGSTSPGGTSTTEPTPSTTTAPAKD